MQDKLKHLVARTLVAKAFAKKAPIIGAIIASEDVLKKLRAAGEDWMSGHPEGAKNEFQQAVTHAVGATVNFVGGVSLVGMSAGLIAQTMAQRHAEQIAQKKPQHPDDEEGMLGNAVKRAKQASQTAKVVETVLRVSQSAPKTRQVVVDLAGAATAAAMGASKIAAKAAGKVAAKANKFTESKPKKVVPRSKTTTSPTAPTTPSKASSAASPTKPSKTTKATKATDTPSVATPRKTTRSRPASKE